MELIFNQINNKWVAEFEAAAHFNLHLERDSEGRLDIYSNGVIADIPYQDGKLVVDMDFAVAIPKQFKIVSASQPTSCLITAVGGDENITVIEPERPEEEGGIIEYHFEIPMEERQGFMGFGKLLFGKLDGDYTELRRKLYDCAKANGDKEEGYLIITEDKINEFINITVNGKKATELDVYFDSENFEFENISAMDMLVEGLMTIDGESPKLYIYPTYVEHSTGLPM